jgi:hypothetical protein
MPNATVETLTLNGVDYVRADQVGPSVPTTKRIVIAQRGWVFVGDYAIDGDDVTLSNAQVIRVWGTTKGLGELALNGPTSTTKLDDAGTVRLHRLAIVATLDVAKWTA